MQYGRNDVLVYTTDQSEGSDQGNYLVNSKVQKASEVEYFVKGLALSNPCYKQCKSFQLGFESNPGLYQYMIERKNTRHPSTKTNRVLVLDVFPGCTQFT